jgi:hypothetical protein
MPLIEEEDGLTDITLYIEEMIWMPIVYRKEPDKVAEVLKAGLEHMTSKSAFTSPQLRSIISEKAPVPMPEQALPVYYLGLLDIVKNKDLQASIHSGWKYILKKNDKTIAHAETVIDPKGRHVFSGTSEGPFIEGLSTAIKVAEEHDEIKVGNFEARLLLIPALHITSLWLVDTEDKSDFVVPIERTPSFLRPNMLIPLKDFCGILYNEAKAALALYQEEDTMRG